MIIHTAEYGPDPPKRYPEWRAVARSSGGEGAAAKSFACAPMKLTLHTMVPNCQYAENENSSRWGQAAYQAWPHLLLFSFSWTHLIM